MTTLDVPSLRNLTALLDILRQLEVDDHRVRLLLNKVETDIGLDVKQAQEAFGGRFVATLPANKGASRSINTGTVVLRSEPRSPLARALVTAIEAVVPADVLPPRASTRAARPGRRRRALGSRSAPDDAGSWRKRVKLSERLNRTGKESADEAWPHPRRRRRPRRRRPAARPPGDAPPRRRAPARRADGRGRRR